MTPRQRRKLHEQLRQLERYHTNEYARSPETWQEGHKLIELLPKWAICPSLGYGSKTSTNFCWFRPPVRDINWRSLIISREADGTMRYRRISRAQDENGLINFQDDLEYFIAWFGRQEPPGRLYRFWEGVADLLDAAFKAAKARAKV